MSFNNYLRWIIEFLCVTAISIVLAISDLNDNWVIVPAIIILISKAFEYRSETNEEYLKIQAQLKLIHKFCSFDTAADVRCVFHKPTWIGKLLQTTGYIPTGAGKGRIFDTKKGIIGKAFNQKMSFVVNFNNDNEYRDRMVAEYGYTVNEIRLRSTDRRSYLCLPLINDANNKVLGLVYFDSSRSGYFSSLEDPRVQEIRNMLRLVKDSMMLR